MYLSLSPETSLLVILLGGKKENACIWLWFSELSLRDTSINDISISLVSIIIWSNLKQICSLCSLKDFCIHTHLRTPSCHMGFYLPFPAHIQIVKEKKKKRKKKKNKAIRRLHIFPLMKLAPFRNDSKCDFVCECVCVCAPALQGGCSDSLRLHSSVCI